MRRRPGLPLLSSFYPAGWLCALMAICAACGDDGNRADGKSRVTMVCDVGGLGDQGFNDAGWRGVNLAASRDPEIEPKIIESREQTDYISNLSKAADTSMTTIALGFLMSDSVVAVAKEYPDSPFVFVDGLIDLPNVSSFDFKSQEGAFLAGILAAAVSETNRVGVMPGMDIPPVQAFQAGFTAGVAYQAKRQGRLVEVTSSTIGSFADPVKARSIAESLFASDIDVVLQLAGSSGLGVLEAVKEAPGRRFMIGVDINQDGLAPGKVLTSILKRIDLVVAREIARVKQGEFQSGSFEVGLAEDAVQLTDMRHTRHLVPPEVFQAVADASRAIVAGDLVPPRTLAELDPFLKSQELN